ncbi:MAG: hypothetical protein A2161_00980 [Candidatus Schekmanbacteria bacterium RBG_13_48_7]|uniref:Uncharacterized protein n=1 Tax=Candidatus Schekmanbacteria bacterium RBG_13_48_7 TaxID=1817878 RepID=A0A1F7RWM8_9BACT|nr:MAG: hypothetical protein A2161_00980 [Candidatus Schekmanbacteria bacterium RBG_13_48_7]
MIVPHAWIIRKKDSVSNPGGFRRRISKYVEPSSPRFRRVIRKPEKGSSLPLTVAVFMFAMFRPLRREYVDAWYHVMNRGKSHDRMFTCPGDYKMFIGLLKETAERWNLRISAYSPYAKPLSSTAKSRLDPYFFTY